MMHQFIANKQWPTIRAMLLDEKKGYYVDQGNGWIRVVIESEGVDCEFPLIDEFNLLPNDIRQFYSPDWETEFESFRSKLDKRDR